MSLQTGRYTAIGPVGLADGWTFERLTQPSQLHGANGIRTGADGRIYVAQVAGSQISAIDPDTGEIETISPMGGTIVAPDDLVFDEKGNLYITEITEARVSMIAPDGTTRVIQGEMPVSNPITWHQGRLIAGECRHGGRIMELDRNGGAPRIILDDAPSPNAFEVGPDGKLYFPAMSTNEIWRIGLDGGKPEIVAKDLGVPDSVKFDRQGFIVSTQVGSGQVLRIDPRTGAKTMLADIGPGLDNCTFVGDRLFASHMTGSIHEIFEPGKVRALVEKGLQWPMGLAMCEDGALYVADGGYCYSLRPGGALELLGMLFSPGYPGFTRGVAAVDPGEFVVTTANGAVARFWPTAQRSEVLAEGFDQLMDVAIAPGGAVVTAEYGTGRVLSIDGAKVHVLADGLAKPMGVAIATDGSCYVGESAGGRVVKLSGGRAETVIDGLVQPQGILMRGSLLVIVDTGSKELIEFDFASGKRRTLATNLPVGAPPGVIQKPMRPFMPLCGAITPFTGIAAGLDGTIYIAGDGEGSVLAIRALRGVD